MAIHELLKLQITEHKRETRWKEGSSLNLERSERSLPIEDKLIFSASGLVAPGFHGGNGFFKRLYA
jgi:hypothetical protein